MRHSNSIYSFLVSFLLVVILLLGNNTPVDAKLKGATPVDLQVSNKHRNSELINESMPRIVGTYQHQRRQLKKEKGTPPSNSTPAETPSVAQSLFNWLMTPFGGVGGFADWAFRVIMGQP